MFIVESNNLATRRRLQRSLSSPFGRKRCVCVCVSACGWCGCVSFGACGCVCREPPVRTWNRLFSLRSDKVITHTHTHSVYQRLSPTFSLTSIQVCVSACVCIFEDRTKVKRRQNHIWTSVNHRLSSVCQCEDLCFAFTYVYYNVMIIKFFNVKGDYQGLL